MDYINLFVFVLSDSGGVVWVFRLDNLGLHAMSCVTVNFLPITKATLMFLFSNTTMNSIPKWYSAFDINTDLLWEPISKA